MLLAACAPTPRGTGGEATAPAHITIRTAPGDTLAFEPRDVAVLSAAPLTMTFRNESNVAHNLVFTDGVTAATRTIVEPGGSDMLSVVPPGPGAYSFVCTIHDGMAGRLLVAPGDEVSTPQPEN